jgi:hypothetical protein
MVEFRPDPGRVIGGDFPEADHRESLRLEQASGRSSPSCANSSKPVASVSTDIVRKSGVSARSAYGRYGKPLRGVRDGGSAHPPPPGGHGTPAPDSAESPKGDDARWRSQRAASLKRIRGLTRCG